MAYGLTEALNKMNELGIFSYALPFMIVFAIIFGLLQKTKILGEPQQTKGINVIIAVAVAGISLMFDVVPTFFQTIFPKFGVALAVFLVLMIFLGFFFMNGEGVATEKLKWIGWVLGLGVVIWAFSEWNGFGVFGGNFGFILQEYLPMFIVIGLIVWGIVAVVGGSSSSGGGNSSK